MAKYIKDSKRFLEKFTYILSKNGGLISFKFNSIQNAYYQKASQKGRRDLIIKSRRLGFSTLCVGEYLARTILFKGINSKIIAHTPQATRTLFEMVKIMYESIESEIEYYKPKTRYNNSYEISFADRYSKISISTAGNTRINAQNTGRSELIHNLHLSEFAFYAYPEELLCAILPCVPITGNITIETTVNSFNYLYDFLQAALKKENCFNVIFYPWFKDPDAYLKGEPLNEYTKKELFLRKEYNLIDTQLRWRRKKISEIGEKKFNQEYPSDLISCFLTTGNPYFDETSLSKHSKNICPPKSEQNGLLIWKEPETNKEYVIGADVASGLADGDYDSATVLDKVTGEEVAVLYARWTPDNFAIRLAELGKKYNNALIAVERNNHGHSVLQFLDKQLHYKNIYKMNRMTNQLGWETNLKTRPIMLDELHQALRKGWHILHFEIGLQELRTFVYHSNGKPAAINGKYDDTVISRAIAWQARKKITFKGIEDWEEDPNFRR